MLQHPDTPLSDVYAALAPRWRAAAAHVAAARAVLRKSPVLLHEGAAVTVAQAARLGVKVLCTESVSSSYDDATASARAASGKGHAKNKDNDIVSLGVFQLPPIPPDIAMGPKGFLLNSDQGFFLDKQRLQLSREFMA